MSTAVKEKKPFLPQRKPAAQPASAAGTAVAVGSPRLSFAANALSIGGEPRVHLLPVEVSQRKKARLLKRRLGFAVVATAVVVAGAYGAVAVTLASAQSQLTALQATTTQLSAQQARFSAVTKVQADSAAIIAAQKTTTANEVTWKPYVADIEASLPAGSEITDFNGSIDAPFGGTATTTTPLGAPHIATIQLTIVMNQNPIGGWLTTLPSLPGFVDATPGSVSKKSTGIYTVAVTIHLNEKALSNRFTKVAGDTK
jgi:Tfp pilus assembly protein PilN